MGVIARLVAASLQRLGGAKVRHAKTPGAKAPPPLRTPLEVLLLDEDRTPRDHSAA
jgi:hypothetical protein